MTQLPGRRKGKHSYHMEHERYCNCNKKLSFTILVIILLCLRASENLQLLPTFSYSIWFLLLLLSSSSYQLLKPNKTKHFIPNDELLIKMPKMIIFHEKPFIWNFKVIFCGVMTSSIISRACTKNAFFCTRQTSLELR